LVTFFTFKIRFDLSQTYFGKLIKETVVPIIDALYTKQQYKVVQEVHAASGNKPISVSVDATYSNWNNNSDHRVVTIVEHATSNNYLLHISMKASSTECKPQQLKSQLILEGLEYVIKECEIPITVVGCDGKRINQDELDAICREKTCQVGDAWHIQRGIVGNYVTDDGKDKVCDGKQKKRIVADTKEIKAEKME
jgi:hypothetical protein